MLYHEGKVLVEKGVPLNVITSLQCNVELSRMKSEVDNDEAHKIDECWCRIKAELENIDKGEYGVSILINRNGNIDGISYIDNNVIFFDVPKHGWGINHHLDAYSDSKRNIKINKKSKPEDFRKANIQYRRILEKICKDNNL